MKIIAVSAIAAAAVLCGTHAREQSQVSVCMDATFTTDASQDQLCAGPSDQQPLGTKCPKKGDVASAGCHKYLKSWSEHDEKCIAREDAQCQPIHTGTWGCVFSEVECKAPDTPTTTPSTGVDQLLDQNKIWNNLQRQRYGEDYFSEMAKGQSPQYLYIGCSDSRVPPEQMTLSGPGDIFVTRNVANQVLPEDQSMIAVVNYAVTALKVTDVLVTGHYGCGGVAAALKYTDEELGLLSPWISTLKEIASEHNETLSKISDEKLKVDCLVELSVYKQMENLNNYGFIQEWKQNNTLTVHPMVYDMYNGILMRLPSEGVSPACAKGMANSAY
jgi:carbonic anhydrase